MTDIIDDHTTLAIYRINAGSTAKIALGRHAQIRYVFGDTDKITVTHDAREYRLPRGGWIRGAVSAAHLSVTAQDNDVEVALEFGLRVVDTLPEVPRSYMVGPMLNRLDDLADKLDKIADKLDELIALETPDA